MRRGHFITPLQRFHAMFNSVAFHFGLILRTFSFKGHSSLALFDRCRDTVSQTAGLYCVGLFDGK